MDFLLQIKIDNVCTEVANQLQKDSIDSSVARTLLELSLNRINLLMTHVGYLESKLESTIESNKMLADHAENLIAENQRLSQIAKY